MKLKFKVGDIICAKKKSYIENYFYLKDSFNIGLFRISHRAVEGDSICYEVEECRCREVNNKKKKLSAHWLHIEDRFRKATKEEEERYYLYKLGQ